MRVLTLTTPDMANGLGCRVTIWVAGCNRHCLGCQNEHTWSYDQGKELTAQETREKIFFEVGKDFIKGITVSGGDPLAQNEGSLKELIGFISEFRSKFPTKDVWIYSGGVYEEMVKDDNIRGVLDLCDVLVDGPFVQSMKDPDLAFRGSTNQRIIDLKRTRVENELVEMTIL